MASISSSQAQAIAEGFLDGLGSDNEGDFVPHASLSALIDLASMIITKAQDNLQQGGHVSSGKGSDSLTVLDPEESAGVISVSIEMAFYLQFINKGVRGTRGGSGQYRFRTENPSKDMVKAIGDWLKKAGRSTFNVKKSVSNLEVKNKTISQYDSAYIVARSIKIKGIRPTFFLDKAITVAQAYANEVLGKALVIDVTNSLPTKLNDGNSNK